MYSSALNKFRERNIDGCGLDDSVQCKGCCGGVIPHFISGAWISRTQCVKKHSLVLTVGRSVTFVLTFSTRAFL